MKFATFYEKYMSIIGPAGNLMFFIQAYKIFTLKSAEAISIHGFILSFVALSSWLLYGFLISNKPIIIANIVGVSGAVLVLIGTLIYQN